MKYIFALILIACSISARAASFISSVAATNDTGRLVAPTNFFQNNVFAGSNVIVEVTNRTGLVIHVPVIGGAGGATDWTITASTTNVTGASNVLRSAFIANDTATSNGIVALLVSNDTTTSNALRTAFIANDTTR